MELLIKKKISRKLAEKKAKSKQHPYTELLLFENYSLPSSILSSKNSRAYSKKMCKKASVAALMRSYDKRSAHSANYSYFL